MSIFILSNMDDSDRGTMIQITYFVCCAARQLVKWFFLCAFIKCRRATNAKGYLKSKWRPECQHICSTVNTNKLSPQPTTSDVILNFLRAYVDDFRVDNKL
jgi:hypothetical protein